MSRSVKIIIATHKKCELPKDNMYFPLHVGAEGKTDEEGKPLDFGIQKDNEGDNISAKNFCFGSLTGLYWGWKNLDTDYVGLVHYRRLFKGEKSGRKNNMDWVLKEEQLRPLLDNYSVFVPQKRKYYIESIYSHYADTINGGQDQLDKIENILKEKYPEYLNSYDTVMKRTWGYMFNIMILRSDLLDSYCTWLFDILFDLENKIDTTGMSDFDKRFCGRVSEILFNVWLEHQIENGTIHKNEIKEMPYFENVNWPNKIKSFLGAKFFHKKYEESF